MSQSLIFVGQFLKSSDESFCGRYVRFSHKHYLLLTVTWWQTRKAEHYKFLPMERFWILPCMNQEIKETASNPTFRISNSND